jgi:hypothetical protein
VQRTLATHLRDRDKERQHHRHTEAVQHFNALLADLVKMIFKCTISFCFLISVHILSNDFIYLGEKW